MVNKQSGFRLRRLRILPVVFALSYILLAAKPASKEWTLEPAGSMQLKPGDSSVQISQSGSTQIAGNVVQSKDSRTAAPAGSIVPFSTSIKYGYFKKDGTLIMVRNLRSNVAMDERGWIEYDKSPSTMMLYSIGGSDSRIVHALGYPFFRTGRRFILRSDQKAISEMDQLGEILWSREFPSIITAFAVGKTIAVVGLLDGSLHEVNNKGEEIVEIRPTGSKVQCIYGTAVSDDGNILTLVSGQEPQMFLVFRKEASGFKLIKSQTLKPETQSSCAMGFSSDNGFELMVNKETSLYYRLSTNKSAQIPTWILPVHPSRVSIFSLSKDIVILHADSSIILIDGGTIVLKKTLPGTTVVPEDGHFDIIDADTLYRYVAVPR
jgi:hypothetical protein